MKQQHFSCGQSGSGGSSQLLQQPPELHSVNQWREEVHSEEQTFTYMLQKSQNNHKFYIYNVLYF